MTTDKLTQLREKILYGELIQTKNAWIPFSGNTMPPGLAGKRVKTILAGGDRGMRSGAWLGQDWIWDANGNSAIVAYKIVEDE